jgi:glycosyltransferase involved in cell wall biosynthesis
MRLAIIGSRGFPSTYGGYETLVRYLARDWTQRGHDVTVYCRRRNGGSRIWWHEGVRCIWTPGFDSNSMSTLSFGLSANFDAMTRGYDAALVLNIANGFYLPMLRARSIPAVVNTDGIEWERGKWGPVARRVFYQGARLTAKYADTLVADSRAIAKIWKHLFGVESRFIPYGATVVAAPKADRVAALGLEARSYVLVVARLIPENNVELVLDALDYMSTHATAVVAGSATRQNGIEARLRALDHDGRIRWLGHVSDQELLTQLWANCGAYVHGHSVGGTNPALLQALGAGAPTLALDTVYNHEVIGRREQLFGPSPQELAERLDELLGNPETRHGFSEHGRAVVADRYAWHDVCAAYLEVLQQLHEDRCR